MAQRVPADKQKVGDTLDPLEFLVTQELNEQYLYGEQDYHPRYLEQTASGPPLVHPGLLLNMSNITRSPSFFLSPGLGAIHAAEECEFIHPARVGQKLKVTWVVRDTYEKRGRPYHVHEAVILDEQGRVILKRWSVNTYVSSEIPIVEKG